MKRQPDFDLDLELGLEGERRAREVFGAVLAPGDGRLRVEVKTDQLAGKTGNVYLEHASRNRNGWEPSGIAVTRADLWAFVLPGSYFITRVEVLREVHAQMIAAKRYLKECSVGSNPTKGIAPPLPVLAAACLSEAWRQATNPEAA